MLDFRPIFYVLGVLLSALSIFMLLPAIFDYFAGNAEWTAFILSSFITMFIGMVMFFANRGYSGNVNIRQAFILTSLTWISLALFSSLPFCFSSTDLSFTNAFFESISALTTTGATIMTGLDDTNIGILLWRSLLQWVGGIGIIVVALAILPMLNIGGMQLFKTESSDKSEKILPRTAQVSIAIASVYLLMTTICFMFLKFAGMNNFDAINHAMTTVSTAGFSTHDQSIAFFDNSKIEYVMTFFMILGGLPFVLFISFIQGNFKVFGKNSQVRSYLTLVFIAITVTAIWLISFKSMPPSMALRYASFNIVSIITTSGFSSYDYSNWIGLPFMLIFILSVVGGCTGSTSGGIKIFRFEVLFASAKSQIAQLIQPNAILKPKYEGKTLSKNIIASIMGFIILFSISFVALSLILSLCGLDFITSVSAAAATLGNVGPGLGEIVGPSGNYASFPSPAKWALTFGMLLGRLEIFTILVLFSSRFWRN